MGLAAFDYLNPSDVIGLGLTPERTNYLDTFNFTTFDIPQLRAAAIEKYDNTISGFIQKFAGVETMTQEKYIWSELEQNASTYDDGVFTITAGVNILTRAASAKVNYRLHEKVQLYTSTGLTGIFIVTEVNSATSVDLGTWDTGSLAIVAAAGSPISAVYSYSLGIEVKMGSSGDDFTTGIRRQYSILSTRPAITREVYSELGSKIPEIKWVSINGQYKWFITEVDDTRTRFLEGIEKKLIEGTIPVATSAALAAGHQGTQGFFSAVEARGATWEGMIESKEDLESLIKHLNKVQGAGVNMLLSSQDQEFAFDTLGSQFNANYGGSAIIPYIGAYNNSEPNKILDLGFQGFKHGGFTFAKQGWKYLKENTFRGNDAIEEENRINFVMVPVGMTPVSAGDQNLAYNTVKTQMNYLTKLDRRPYDSWVTGGAGWMGARTDGDDKFTVHFIEESGLAVFNAEKFIIGKGVAGS